MTWWRRLLSRDRLDSELDRELNDHIERQVADFVRGGMTEAEARRRARLSFGGEVQITEACRDARGTRWVEDIVQDIRYSIRILLRSPAFALVAILSLALGIGANTAIFSIVNSLLLRSLPVRAPEQLLILEGGSWTNPIWEQIRDHHPGLVGGAAAWGEDRFDLASGGVSDSVDGLWTSGNFFDVLGTPAILGRTFGPDDDRRGGGPAGPVAVIGYKFWQRHYGGAAEAIGRPLTINRVTFTVIGVTGPEFVGPIVGRSYDVAVPLGDEPLVRGKESFLDGRSTWWLDILVRMKPGQTVEQATLALRGAQPQIRQATLPDWDAQALKEYLGTPFVLQPAAGGSSQFRNQYREPLLIILAIVGLVLLIACANIANIMLARANARRHELGLRIALGASRWRIARQLLTESLLLSVLGAALGLVFAAWGSALLVAQLSTFQENVFLDISLDWRVMAFTAGIAIATALLFGMVPAFRAGRVEPNDALKDQSRTVSGERHRMLGQPLVVVQVALSLVLVVAAGLFLRSFAALAMQNVGFDRDALLVVNLDVQKSGVESADRPRLLEQVLAATGQVPGVARAGLSAIPPMSGMGWNNFVEVPGGTSVSQRDSVVWFNGVTPGWFATYGTTLVNGRDFAASDRKGAPGVVIANQAFVSKFLPGANPLGRIVRQPSHGFGGNDQPVPSWQIVGVVANAAYRTPREPDPPTLYLPLDQSEMREAPFATLTVRSALDNPAQLTKSVAAAIGRVNPRLALTFLPMTEQISGLVVRERIVAMLAGFFGGLALLLAAIGLYGITSYGVSRRRTEIGIRMALGADAASVVRLVLRRAAMLVGLGVVIGAGLSLWASSFVASLLYGLTPRDPITLVGAAATLAAVGAFAAWLPARRAARIDPIEVLRES
jgi:putative ABC transport system permease protein